MIKTDIKHMDEMIKSLDELQRLCQIEEKGIIVRDLMKPLNEKERIRDLIDYLRASTFHMECNRLRDELEERDIMYKPSEMAREFFKIRFPEMDPEFEVSYYEEWLNRFRGGHPETLMDREGVDIYCSMMLDRLGYDVKEMLKNEK